MINHHISDLVARLKNAATLQQGAACPPSEWAAKPVKIFKTKDNYAILNILSSLGFISWCPSSPELDPQEKSTYYLVKIKPGLKNIQVLSRPGRRIYLKVQDIKTQKQGMLWFILRTSQGIMTHYQALELGLGGEALLKVQ